MTMYNENYKQTALTIATEAIEDLEKWSVNNEDKDLELIISIKEALKTIKGESYDQ